MARPIWNSNPILSEEERMKQRLIQAQIQRRQQLQKARSGSLLRQQGTYEAAPKATSSWDNLFTPNEAGGVNLNPPFNIVSGRPTIEINKGPRPRPHLGLPQAGSPFSNLDELRKKNQKTSPFSLGMLEAMRSGGAKHHAGMAVPEEEEDEFMSYDDQMFLLALMEGMQGGKPPTPYGTAVGGGNKSWASLPFPGMA
jgi:hypothetical protein